MINISIKKLALAAAITTALLSNQALFAADIEVSLPDASSAFTIDQPVGTELMRIDGSGNVGIGTETPSSKLHIKSATMPNVLFEDDSKMFSTGISGDNFRVGNVVNCGGANMHGNQLVVDGTGETGLNTTSPEAELHVKNKLSGIAACSLQATAFPASFILEGGKKWKLTSWDLPPQAFPNFTPDGQRLGIINQENYEVMSFYGNGNIGIAKTDPREKLDVEGNIKASGSVFAAEYITTSDKRLKKDITPLVNSLDKITKLQGVSFKWKDTENHSKKLQLGLIAQDVESIFPEIVNSANDEQKTRSVNYTALISVLIEGMKEQQKRIEALEAKLK